MVMVKKKGPEPVFGSRPFRLFDFYTNVRDQASQPDRFKHLKRESGWPQCAAPIHASEFTLKRPGLRPFSSQRL